MENVSKASAIRERVLAIERLGAFPQVAMRLLDAIGDDKTNVSDLTEIIESDMALASKILSLANSAFYAPKQKITTIHRSIVVIGFEELQLLAVGFGLSDIFDPSHAPEGFDVEGLWKHSMAVGWMAKNLASTAGGVSSSEVMIAGLLHDLGKLILAGYLPEELQKIMILTNEGIPFCRAEERIGIDHTTVGYWLARNWDLPEIHLSAIRDHHDVRQDSPHARTTSLVATADILTKKLELGLVHESESDDALAFVQYTGLTPAQLESISDIGRKDLPPLLETWISAFSAGG